MAGTTFDSAAMTLGEYATQSNDPIIQNVTYSLYHSGNMLQDIPFVTRKTFVMNGSRFVAGNTPGINWVPLNTPGTVTKGKATPYQEQAYLLRNIIQIDNEMYDEVNSIGNPLDIQAKAWMKGFAYDWNTKFINNGHPGVAASTGMVTGSTNTDINAPVGLRARLDNPATYQMISEMKISAGGVDITSTGLTVTTAQNFIAKVQTLLDYMDASNGDGVVLYLNDYAKRRFEAAVRIMGAGGGFTMTKDAFDRKISTYSEAKVRDVGRRNDGITRVILPTETSAGADGGTNLTSMYGVNYGIDTFCAWQSRPLKPQDLGVDPTNGVIRNIAMNWMAGLWVPSNRAFGRLYNFAVD